MNDKTYVKNGLLFLWVLFFMASCNIKPENSFTISGELTGNTENKMLYLHQLTPEETLVIDSLQLAADGEFSFSAMANYPEFYLVNASMTNRIPLLIKPGDEIHLKANIDDLNANYMVEGSSESALIKQLIDKQNRTMSRVADLGDIYRDSLQSENLPVIKQRLDSIYSNVMDEHEAFTKKFIGTHPASFASIMTLYHSIDPRETVLDPLEDYEFFALVDSNLMALYPNSVSVQSLNEHVKEVSIQKRHQESVQKRLQEGAVAPNISLPGYKGDTLSLSDLRGNYVLLSFWASWSKPSREQHRALRQAYYRYRKKGFDIYQVSLDQSKDPWVDAIRLDNIYWNQVSDLKYWNSLVVPLYNLKELPVNYLLDPEGRIIAKNLYGDELSVKLAEIFSN